MLALADGAAAFDPVRELAARHFVTDTRTAGSEQTGSEASRLLLVLSGNRDSDARSAIAKQDSLADAVYRPLINPA